VDADDNKEDEEEEEELISEESNEFISSSELRRNRISSKGSFTLNCYRIFGSKNGVSIFSWLSINTVVAKKKKKKKNWKFHNVRNIFKKY